MSGDKNAFNLRLLDAISSSFKVLKDGGAGHILSLKLTKALGVKLLTEQCQLTWIFFM